MPLLVRSSSVTPPPPPPGGGPVPPAVGVTWYAPDGTAWDLMNEGNAAGLVVPLEGIIGLGAAPRELYRQDLHTGGSAARWAYMAERIITLPILLYDRDPNSLSSRRRELIRAFTQTTPTAGVPRPGRLRITRADGNWREIYAYYLDGLESFAQHPLRSEIEGVVQLLATDPRWYGEQTVAAEFATTEGRNYLDPYETVSPTAALGSQVIQVMGDLPASPVWTITGPAEVVSVKPTDGFGWQLNGVAPGEQVVIDVERKTVRSSTLGNRIGSLTWPGAILFELEPGEVSIDLEITGGSPGVSSIRLEYRPRWESE